jgi:hypothetical protein
MAVPITHSGKVGKGLIGSVAIHLTKCDELDATTAEDDGYEVTDVGVVGVTANVSGYYFVGATKIATLRPARGTNLYLYTYKLGVDVGQFWLLPNFVVTEFRHSSEVRGKIEFTATFRSRGTYTAPVDPA